MDGEENVTLAAHDNLHDTGHVLQVQLGHGLHHLLLGAGLLACGVLGISSTNIDASRWSGSNSGLCLLGGATLWCAAGIANSLLSGSLGGLDLLSADFLDDWSLLDNDGGGNLLDDWSGDLLNNWGSNFLDNWGSNFLDNWGGHFLNNRGGNFLDNWGGDLLDNRGGNLLDDWCGDFLDNWCGDLLNRGGDLFDLLGDNWGCCNFFHG